MKRVIPLLAIIAILLCGCSAAAESQDSTDPQPSNSGDRGIAGFFSDIADSIGDAVEAEKEPLLELGKGTKQNSIAILKITVNPEFELYLDTDSCVSRVRCLNEDAVTAFQNMTNNEINVIGLAYADAMPVILDALSDTGFLTAETEQIQIETTVHIELPEDDLATLAAALAEPVEQYSTEKELALTVEAPVPEVDTEVALEVPEYEVQEAKPNAVITYEATGGSGSPGTYTEYYDENGVLSKTEGRYEDGSYSNGEFASNGCMTYHENIAADGSGYIETYDEYGNQTSLTGIYADGARSEVTYHSNGNPATSVYTYPDGRTRECIFSKSGVELYGKSVDEDGAINESTRYENGNTKSSIYDGPDGHLEWHYFEDGTMSKYIDTTWGDYWEKNYHSSGQVAVEIRRGDGYSTETHYDESGKKIYIKSESGSSSYLIEGSTLVYYYQDGEQVTDPDELKEIKMRFAAGGIHLSN